MATALLGAVGVGVVAGLIPVSAHAGIFSFFEDARAKQGAVDAPSATGRNVQNMDLLRAPTAPGGAGASGGGDILIKGDSALAAGGRPGVDRTADMSDTSGRIRVYVVREGDNLSQIAEMFDVTVNTIRWSNELGADEAITPGQKLVILPITGVRHTVEEGDTLSSIAKEYDGNLEEIREFNNFSGDPTLAVGDKVVIPNGEMGHSGSAGDAHDHGSAAPSAPAPRGGSGVSGGYYAHPAPGAIVTQRLHGYNAVDFGAAAGTPVTAAAPGQVIISRNGGWNGGYGTYVVIKHPNQTETLYSHQSRNTVSVGQQVQRGQVVGYMGSTGRSTGTHVHFEVRGAKNPFSGCALRTTCR